MFRSKDFIGLIYKELTDRYGPSYLWKQQPLPAGLRLELHPSLYHTLWSDPELWSLHNILRGEAAGLEGWFRIPVKSTNELLGCTWRLVIVTEEVLASGIPDIE